MYESEPHNQYRRAQSRTLQMLAALIALLLISRFLPMPGLQGFANYLPLHMLMETIAEQPTEPSQTSRMNGTSGIK